MPVNARVQAQTDGPADCFGDLALADGPETGELAVLDTAKVGHEFGNEGWVLVLMSQFRKPSPIEK